MSAQDKSSGWWRIARSGPRSPARSAFRSAEARRSSPPPAISPLSPAVSLMLSGHIHSFEAINYEAKIPPQVVAGFGGDNLDVTPGRPERRDLPRQFRRPREGRPVGRRLRLPDDDPQRHGLDDPALRFVRRTDAALRLRRRTGELPEIATRIFFFVRVQHRLFVNIPPLSAPSVRFGELLRMVRKR